MLPAKLSPARALQQLAYIIRDCIAAVNLIVADDWRPTALTFHVSRFSLCYNIHDMILVDDIRRYSTGPRGWLYWCHMASDDLSEDGLEQLHLLAESIGLRREWFQNHPRHPHYDLPPDKRDLAIEAGATPVSSRELVRRCSRRAET